MSHHLVGHATGEKRILQSIESMQDRVKHLSLEFQHLSEVLENREEDPELRKKLTKIKQCIDELKWQLELLRSGQEAHTTVTRALLG